MPAGLPRPSRKQPVNYPPNQRSIAGCHRKTLVGFLHRSVSDATSRSQRGEKSSSSSLQIAPFLRRLHLSHLLRRGRGREAGGEAGRGPLQWSSGRFVGGFLLPCVVLINFQREDVGQGTNRDSVERSCPETLASMENLDRMRPWLRCSSLPQQCDRSAGGSPR